MKKFLIFILIVTSSCSSIDKKIFKSNKGNYITTEKGVFVKVSYKEIDKINPDSRYKLSVTNSNNNSLFIFSTVLENSEMFYSKKNYSIKNDKIIFDSYYRDYMNEVIHSGISKFNFIEVLPGKSLNINIDESFISNKESIELRYYYFYGTDKKELLDISNEKLKSKIILLNI